MQRLLKVHDTLVCIVNAVGWAGKWFALLLSLATVFDVITRRFFVLGSTYIQDLEWHLHAVLFLFCFGAAYLADVHVRIDLVREGFSPRVKAMIELTGIAFFFIPYCLVVLYFGWEFWLDSFMADEGPPNLTEGIPHRWIIKFSFLIGISVLLLACIAGALRQILMLFGDERIKAALSRMPADEPDAGLPGERS